ncbi:hypothetical protein AVEN_232336-1 [Araneus ventricosus]|uniref:ATP-dependent DNA helicase n=1 Tax=Araneus ventricosus TaxID=182803 RepID=A0A4Y2I8I2_ARAVE|nr:hypothetical protein AVEN_232336-1 [Araneus ventricosus]
MPFEGNVIAIGNFRQKLPVVQRGTRVDVIESCIKSRPLLPVFTHLILAENMRSCGKLQHNERLLNIRTGSLPGIETLYHDYINIPHRIIEEDNLIDCICGGNLIEMDVEQLAKRVILALTNKKTLEMNQHITDKFPGKRHMFYSSDSIISEDPNNVINY